MRLIITSLDNGSVLYNLSGAFVSVGTWDERDLEDNISNLRYTLEQLLGDTLVIQKEHITETVRKLVTLDTSRIVERE